MMKKVVLSSLCWLAMLALEAQVPVGQWRVHLPYAFATSVEITPETVYCGTKQGLFTVSREDFEVRTLSRINGLTDQGITYMRYSEDFKTLIITYESGNIDLLRNGRFTRIDAIVRANLPGNKRINHIHLKGRFAYLSCAFGIVELDLQRTEIRNTFIIGPEGSRLPVSALTDDGTNFYAATDSGMFVAALNAPNLSNYAFWQPEAAFRGTKLTHIDYFDSAVVTIQDDELLRYRNGNWTGQVLDAGFENTSLTVRNGHLLVTNTFRVNEVFADESFAGTASNPLIQRPTLAVRSGIFTWMADDGGGLFRYFEGLGEQLLPNGPGSEKAVHISADRTGVLVSAGGFNSVLVNRYSQDGVFQLENEKWTVLNRGTLSADNKFFDVIQAKYDPFSPGLKYLLPWGGGLLAVRDTSIEAVYTPVNSSLEYIPGSVNPTTGIGDTRVGGIDFDAQGNVWVSNYGASQPVSVRRRDGSWESFSLGPYNQVIDMVVDNSGNKWVRSRSGGVVVLNRENNRFVNPNTAEGSGSLPSPIVNCITKDKSGAIWIGTAEGPVVFFNPNAVFRDRYDAQQIKIQQEQFVGFLLGNEVVTAIAIDGADRKWFGTANGVWLFSADGTTQIHHFTSENSPLLSNIITSIAIHPLTGEVFIGTDRGVISYRGTATEGAITHTNVKVFPNPVRPEYDGMVSVSGLVTNNWIKITDISGNLVFQTRADGGQVSWNGRDIKGQRVATGVYLVLSTSDLGEETVAAKIVFIQ